MHQEMKPKRPLNIFSVDLEDYFMVTALEEKISRNDWTSIDCRIERNTHRILEILDNSITVDRAQRGESFCPPAPTTLSAKRTCATFFCLGWIAERYPHLIREIQARGHEIASHGYDHRMVTTLSPGEFREDIRKSKAILEDLTGERVLGYRAPSYSITRQTLWALEILSDEGYLYDSSIFPVHHDRYGIPDAPRSPFVIRLNGGQNDEFLPLNNPSCDPKSSDFRPSRFLLEFPVSTIRLFGQNIPIGGGGYFRLLPGAITQWALRRLNERENLPAVFFIHPWEIDPAQPRVAGLSPRSRFRHYLNLHSTESKLIDLLATISFSSFKRFIEHNGFLI